MPAPEDVEPPARPARTWGPMLLGTGAILLALLAVWLYVAVWPVWQVQLAVDRLAREKDDPDAVRKRTFASLGGKEATARKVTRYLQTARRSTAQRTAALRLLEYSFTREAIPGLIILAGDEDPSIRNNAVEWLSDEMRGDPRAFDVLAAALFDKKERNPNTRAWAAIGVSSIADPRSLEVLVTALRNEDEDVRYAAAQALLTQAHRSKLDKARTAELLRPLPPDEDKDVRQMIEELRKELEPSAPPK